MTQGMSQLHLLDSLKSGHLQFKTFIAGLTAEQMQQPNVVGVWSIKNILAHIVVHEQRMIDWVTKTLRGEKPEAPQPYSMPEEALNRLNEQIYQQNRDRPLVDVLTDLETTHLQTLDMVAAASERDLLDPRRFSLQDGEPLWEAIAANTFWHYEEHGRDIRAWLSGSARIEGK